MIEEILIGIMISCSIVVVISLIMLYRERGILNTPISELKIPKNHFVNLVIEWCHANLKFRKTRKPRISIRYYKNKKVHGTYNPTTHEVVIYINNHTTLKQLTNTTIHEYIHARQKDRSFNRNYTMHNQTVGYWNNPYEIESRKVSKSKEEACVLFLAKKYKILG